MRAFLIRVIFLLISANVAYGTSGDFYAEKVQTLLDPSHAPKFLYKPYINSELFIFSREKAAKAATEQSPDARVKPAAAHVAGTFSNQWVLIDRHQAPYQQQAAPAIYILAIRQLIFPRHTFL